MNKHRSISKVAVVIMLLLAFGFAVVAFSAVTSHAETSKAVQVHLGPLVLDENFEVYYTGMQRSSSSCFSVVWRNQPGPSATDCVTGVTNARDMVEDARVQLNAHHESVTILLNALSGYRCIVVIPKNPGPEDVPSIGC